MSRADLGPELGDASSVAEAAPLSAASRELLADYRTAISPTPAALDGLWAQLGADLDAGMTPQPDDAGVPAAGEAAAASGPATGLGGAAWAMIAVGLGAAALVVMATVGGAPAPSPSPALVPTLDEAREVAEEPAIEEVPAPAEVASRSRALVDEPVVSPALVAPAAGPPRAKGGGGHGTRASARPAGDAEAKTEAPPVSSGTSLADERALLERLRRALADGRPTEAKELLAAYDARFAAPVLEEERDVLEIRGLCLAGDDARAQDRARRFRSRYPLSAHGPQLLRGCE